MDTRRGNQPTPETSREPVESKPQREIVRAFMVQSAFHRDIASHLRKRFESGEDVIDAITETSFMQVILMEKGQESTKNPGQLLPVGGNIEGTETAEQAMVREMQEETQLRAYTTQAVGDMTYTHESTKGDAQDVRTQYFVADVAPSDHAYALHPDEDKSRSFPHLTYQELVTLWSEGSVEHDNTPKPMLDSLWPTLLRKEEEGPIPTSFTPEEEGKMWRVMREVAVHMEEREFEKKTRVVEHMRALLRIKNADMPAVTAQIEKKNTLENNNEALDAWYKETMTLFEEFTNSSQALMDVFIQATEMTNFEEEIAHAGKSEPEAALRFMMTLLDLDFERDTYLELAKNNELLGPLAEKIAKFGTTLQEAAGESNPSILSQQSVLEAYAGIDTLEEIVGSTETEQFLRQKFTDIFIDSEYEASSRDIGTRLTDIHNFINEMQKEMQYFESETLSPAELRVYDEVRSADLTTLLQFAVPTPNVHTYFRDERFSAEKKRGIVFESRRAVILLMLFAKYDAAYDKVIDRRNQPIQRIITNAFPSSETSVYVETWESDEHLKNGMPAYRKKEKQTPEKEHDTSKLGEKQLRTFTDDQGQTYYLSTHDRTKSRASFHRKVIVRGNVVPEVLTSDVNARSIVLSAGTPEHPYRSERIRRTLTSYPISDIHGEVSVAAATKEYEDESAVFAVIDQLTSAAEKLGKTMRIIDFKPTPLPGESFGSAGAGGAAAIRLAKCYIEYVSPNGERTREEIQIFTPTIDQETDEVDISAFAYEQQKKDDDHSYAVKRLLQTQGLRSVVELLWPNRIYGDVFRQVHSKKSTEDAVKKRKRKSR